jgi:hypothetical protein
MRRRGGYDFFLISRLDKSVSLAHLETLKLRSKRRPRFTKKKNLETLNTQSTHVSRDSTDLTSSRTLPKFFFGFGIFFEVLAGALCDNSRLIFF